MTTTWWNFTEKRFTTLKTVISQNTKYVNDLSHGFVMSYQVLHAYSLGLKKILAVRAVMICFNVALSIN
jgi:hypothetical protein